MAMGSKRLILLWREKATVRLTFYKVCETLPALLPKMKYVLIYRPNWL
jgi:hypothetical protein